MTEIHLNEDDRAFVEELVAAGVYRNAEEVVSTALRMLGSEEGKVTELQRLIQEGVDDLEAGRVIEFESAEALTAHILQMAEDERNAAAPTVGHAKSARRSSANS